MEKNIRIFLVDDDEDIFELLQFYFDELYGDMYELDWVATYEDGLIGIQEEKHDVYLIDYRLGEKNGLDLLRAAADGYCKKPLIRFLQEKVYGIVADFSLWV